ncbi:hypothetical protein CKA32_006963 [Geitlerinema sp. FC II]|nr:hypothetical protein CKA32_006963 [Geitlerinema sp. FC II]
MFLNYFNASTSLSIESSTPLGLNFPRNLCQLLIYTESDILNTGFAQPDKSL